MFRTKCPASAAFQDLHHQPDQHLSPFPHGHGLVRVLLLHWHSTQGTLYEKIYAESDCRSCKLEMDYFEKLLQDSLIEWVTKEINMETMAMLHPPLPPRSSCSQESG